MNKPIAQKRNRFVHGVGVNDADYPINPVVDGKRVMCPYYQSWMNMFRRCYSAKYQDANPSYKGCSVSAEWHSFMTFRAWMSAQDWKGFHLDKDILIEGNKIYGPDTCVFIDREVNWLLNDCAAARGDLPLGVTRHYKNYRAQCFKNGKKISLGTYAAAEEAHLAYLAFKAKVIISAALTQPDNRVFKALILRAKKMSEMSKVARR